MAISSSSITVGTSAVSLGAPGSHTRRLIEVTVHAVGAVEVGGPGVTVGQGIPLAAAEKKTFVVSEKDELWAVAAVATTVRVLVVPRLVS